MFSSVQSAVRNACIKSYVGVQSCAAGVKSRVLSERGEVNVVAIVVLIGVAVVLALIFRKEVGDLITGLLATIKENAGSAIAPSK